MSKLRKSTNTLWSLPPRSQTTVSPALQWLSWPGTKSSSRETQFWARFSSWKGLLSATTSQFSE